MDYKEYRKDTFEKLSQFDMTFKPWKKWQNVKLTNLNPCYTCPVQSAYIANRYVIMMSEGADEEFVKQCQSCTDKIFWAKECLEKLKWYEDHDERLK